MMQADWGEGAPEDRDRPLWTIGRVAAWIGATFALIFLSGLAMGLTAAWLDKGTGAHLWRDRIMLAVPLVVLGIMGGATALALRRIWPRRPGPEAEPWERAAADRARRTAVTWAVALGALALAGLAVPLAVRLGVATTGGAAVLAVGIASALVGIGWGTVHYMRVIDDHERRANLYCGYAGLTTYLVLFFAQMVARMVADLPRMDDGIFGVTVLVATVTFCIVRFR